MAGENGSARPYIATKPPLSADVRNCNFYVLMEALYRRYGAPGRDISLRTEPAQEIVRFSSDANIGFPGTDLSVLSRSQNGQYVLQTRFLGFSGSQSPLPGYYLDQMAQGVRTERRRPERISRSIQPPLDTVCLSCSAQIPLLHLLS